MFMGGSIWCICLLDVKILVALVVFVVCVLILVIFVCESTCEVASDDGTDHEEVVKKRRSKALESMNARTAKTDATDLDAVIAAALRHVERGGNPTATKADSDSDEVDQDCIERNTSVNEAMSIFSGTAPKAVAKVTTPKKIPSSTAPAFRPSSSPPASRPIPAPPPAGPSTPSMALP